MVHPPDSDRYVRRVRTYRTPSGRRERASHRDHDGVTGEVRTRPDQTSFCAVLAGVLGQPGGPGWARRCSAARCAPWAEQRSQQVNRPPTSAKSEMACEASLFDLDDDVRQTLVGESFCRGADIRAHQAGVRGRIVG